MELIHWYSETRKGGERGKYETKYVIMLLESSIETPSFFSPWLLLGRTVSSDKNDVQKRKHQERRIQKSRTIEIPRSLFDGELKG